MDSKEVNDDEATMKKLGYEQELYRGFNYFMNFAFTVPSLPTY